ncbi:MAG: hypothetical protein QM752_02440 [Gammaproteobacteria bacterium]
MTNKFFRVESDKDEKYLIRMNGKLWPPFNRDDENYNLKKLRVNGIETTVLKNRYKNEWQICKISEDTNFFEIRSAESGEHHLKEISRSIKKYQQIKDFKNSYSLPSTIVNCMKGFKNFTDQNIQNCFQIVLSIATLLHFDKRNHVFSHNDLLPSSIYLSGEKVKIVDWEYSGENHFSYDLSLLSIKSGLSRRDEEALVYHYDPLHSDKTQYYLTLMKPVVNFFLLLWSFPKHSEVSEINKFPLYSSMISYIQDAMSYQMIKSGKFLDINYIEKESSSNDEYPEGFLSLISR